MSRAVGLSLAGLSALIGVLLLSSSPAAAQDFELHPAYITGTIQLGTVTISYGSVGGYAYDPVTGQSLSASTSLEVTGPGTATYSLTVEGGLQWTIYASVYTYSPGFLSISLPAASAAPAVGETAVVDFLFPDWTPGTIHGTVTVVGGTLDGGSVSSWSHDAPSLNWTGVTSTQWGGISPSGEYSYTVGPGTGTQYGSVQVDGMQYDLPVQSFVLPYGGDLQIDYVLEVTQMVPGSISGYIGVSGVSVEYAYVYGWGPQGAYRSDYLEGAGIYTLEDAAPGEWWLNAWATDYMPETNAYRAYSYPYRVVSVAPGEDVTGVDFTFDPAFVGGTIDLGDYGAGLNSASLSMWGSGYDLLQCCASTSWGKNYYAYALPGDPASWPIPDSEPYEVFIDPASSWNFTAASLFLSYQYEIAPGVGGSSWDSVWANVWSSYLHDLSAGDYVTLDIDGLGFTSGTLTLHLTVAGGGLLEGPYVSCWGSQEGLGSFAWGNGYTENGWLEGELGTVQLTLAPAVYTCDAYAVVQGSWTQFGHFTATVTPGEEVEQDLNAPDLTVLGPDSGFVTCDASVNVYGTVSDASGVASVTVNGVAVASGSDGVWNATVDLAIGSNEIVVVATDAQGNTVTKTRTVTRLSCGNSPPTPDAGGPYAGTEGNPITLSGLGSADPDGDNLTYAWDVDGDGIADLAGATVSYAWPDDFSGFVTLWVSDGVNDPVGAQAAVAVANVPPAVTLTGEATVSEGDPLLVAGGFEDPGADTWVYGVNWGDGTPDEPALSGVHTYGGEGTYFVNLYVVDDDGGVGNASFWVTVVNAPPTVSLSPHVYVAYSMTLRIAGQPGDVVCIQVTQAGQGGGACLTRTTGSPNTQSLTGSFTVDLLQPFDAVLTFETSSRKMGATPVWFLIDGGMTKATTFVTDPSDPGTWQQTYAVPGFSGMFHSAGKTVTFSGTVADAGADLLAVTWNLGDGTTQALTFEGPGSFALALSHTYLTAGTYTVTLSVDDGDGGQSSASLTFTIT